MQYLISTNSLVETYKIPIGIHPAELTRDDISVNGKQLWAPC